MNIDWAALGSVFGVSLVVTVALVGLFTLGIVGLSRRERGTGAQGDSAAAGRHRRVRLLRRVRGGGGVRDLSDRGLTRRRPGQSLATAARPRGHRAVAVTRGAVLVHPPGCGGAFIPSHDPRAGVGLRTLSRRRSTAS